MSLSAVVSLLQYPCFTLVRGALHGDPFYVGTLARNQRIEEELDLRDLTPSVFIDDRWTWL